MQRLTTISSLATVVCLLSSGAAAQTNWSANGPADFFSVGNWDNGIPTVLDNAFINNGGTATATSGGPVTALELTVGDIVNGGDGTLILDGVDLDVVNDLNIAGERNDSIGNQTVAGSVTVQDTNLFQVSPVVDIFDTYVGNASAGAGQNVNAIGSLTIDNVATVVLGNDMEIGEIGSGSLNYGNANITTDAMVNINNAGSVSLLEDLEMARITGHQSDAGAVLNANATLTISNVIGLFDIGCDLEVARANIILEGDFSGQSTSIAHLTLSNVGAVNVGEDIDAARLTLDSSDSITISGAISQEATIQIEDVGTMDIDEDIELGWLSAGQTDSGSISGSATATGSMTVTNVANLNVTEDIELGVLYTTLFSNESFTGVATATGMMTLTNVQNLNIGQDLEVGLLVPNELAVAALAGTATANGQLTLNDTNAVLTSSDDHTQIGVLRGENLPVTGGDPQASGNLTMNGSTLETPTLEVGTTTAGFIGTVSGVVELDSSYVSTSNLILGSDSNLIFHIDGPTRVTSNTAGAPDTYAAIDADSASLNGTLDVVFDQTPVANDVFDLIRLPQGAQFQTPFTTINVAGLPLGSNVVVEVVPGTATDGEILRATVDSVVNLGDVNLDGSIDLLDVESFIDRLSTATYQAEADCNQDGALNLLDVGPFVAILGNN